MILNLKIQHIDPQKNPLSYITSAVCIACYLTIAFIGVSFAETSAAPFLPSESIDQSIKLTVAELEHLSKSPVISAAATPDWPPFEMRQAGDAYTGLSADFLRLAAAKVGLEIAPVFDPKWDNHTNRLKKGEVDVVAGLNKIPSRLEYLVFTQPYIEYYFAIFVGSRTQGINGIEDLYGKTVVLESGYATARTLPREHPKINTMLVDTTLEALQAVANGKADAYIGNHVVGSYLLKKFTLVSVRPVAIYNKDQPGQLRIAVRKDRPLLLDALQKGLDAISQSERDTILSTYIDINAGFRLKTFFLKQGDWEWLHRRPGLNLGISNDFPPFEFVGPDGEHQGIASEYARNIAGKLMTDFRPRLIKDHSKRLEALSNGEVDLIAALARSPKRMRNFQFTEPYLAYPIVIFSQNITPLPTGLDELKGHKVAVVQGHVAQEFLQQNHSNLDLVAYSDAAKAVEALSLGKVDFLVNDMASGFHAIESKGFTTLKVTASTPYQLEICMAAAKSQSRLVAILDQALNVISVDEAVKMKSKWLAMRFEHGWNLATVLSWALPISLVLAVVFAVISVWNRRLDREIEKRKQAQKDLKAANEKLQRMAVYDGLTRIPNRRHFDDTLEAEWQRLKRDREPLALAILDIDYFKLYNDTRGHQAGDSCLVQIAQTMQSLVQRPADLLARCGGEEFAILLPNTDSDGAAALAEQVRKAVFGLKISHSPEASHPFVSLSLGVASIIPAADTNSSDLVSLADEALYRAKEKGRNRVEVSKGIGYSFRPA